MLLVFLLLSSCASQPNSFTLTGSAVSTLEQTAVSTEPPFMDNEPYSFSEVNTLFGPGPFSVNELAKIFGEPNFISGYYSEEDGENGFFVLNATFENIMFDLEANNGEKLNFIIKDDSESPISYGRYEVTDSDKEVQMKPRSTSVLGGNWALPRKINFGDSIEAIYKAYNGNKGKERDDGQGQFTVSYDYGESGRITYEFDFNSEYTDVIDELKGVSIEWYDAYNYWKDSPAPSVSPSKTFYLPR